MATIYSVPDPQHQVLRLVAALMRRHHRPLHDAGVRVGVLFAANPAGPAVSHGGYPAHATIKIVPLKDRLTKNYDVELLVSEESWERFDDGQRAALVDHELTHVETVVKNGRVSRDDINRPKLKTRKGDWNCGDGFAEVVARHGRSAVEFVNAARAAWLAENSLPDGDDSEDGTESPPPPQPPPAPEWWIVLGVARTTPTAEVEAAYQKLARAHHPDRGGEKTRMQQINAAYEAFRKERGS